MQWLISNSLNPISTRQLLALMLLVVTAVGVFYIPYLEVGIFVHEEPRRALIARTMLSSGDYFVPILTNEVYTAKPPVYNWLVALSASSFGELNEFSARFVSVFSLTVLALAMLLLMRRYFSSVGLVMLAAGIILVPEMISKAPLNEIEVLFTLLVTVSLWLWFYLYDKNKRGLRLWFWPCLIVAVSFLTKREPAIVFFYFATFAFLLHKREIKEIFSVGHIISAAMMATVIGSWLWIMIDQVGLEGLIASSQKEVLERGTHSSTLRVLKHVFVYPLELLVASLPYGALLLLLSFRTVRIAVFKRYGDMAAFAIIAIMANLPIYLLRGDVAVRYFLPMFPTMVIMSVAIFEAGIKGVALSPFAQRGYRLLTQFFFATVCLVLVTLIGFEIGSYWVTLPDAVLPFWLRWGLLVLSAAAIYIAQREGKTNPFGKMLLVFILFGVMIRLTHFEVLLPRHLSKLAEQRNVPSFAAAVQSHTLSSLRPVVAWGFVPYDVWYYLPEGKLISAAHADRTAVKPQYIIAFQSELPPSYDIIASMNYRGRPLVLAKGSGGDPF